MCGIMGYIGGGDAAVKVYEGLKRLEYRGYDSAGGAFISDGGIEVVKKEGRVEKLPSELVIRVGLRTAFRRTQTRTPTAQVKLRWCITAL